MEVETRSNRIILFDSVAILLPFQRRERSPFF